MTTLLCHYCEADVTDGRKHDCPFISLAEIHSQVADTALYADYSYSITSGCRLQAICQVYRWAYLFAQTHSTKPEFHDDAEVFLRKDIEDLTEKWYRHYEYGEPAPAEEIETLPSPSPGPEEGDE